MDAGVCDCAGLAPVRAEGCGELLHCGVSAPGRTEQKPLAIHVVHVGAVVVAAVQARLVDAHNADLAHDLLVPCLWLIRLLQVSLAGERVAGGVGELDTRPTEREIFEALKLDPHTKDSLDFAM